MKYIFTSDLHLQKYNNDSVKLPDGTSLKLKETLDCFEELCKYAILNNVLSVIIGGDIVHHKDRIETIPFIRFKRLLDK